MDARAIVRIPPAAGRSASPLIRPEPIPPFCWLAISINIPSWPIHAAMLALEVRREVAAVDVPVVVHVVVLADVPGIRRHAAIMLL